MGKSIYFVSDFHFGADARLSSLERMKATSRWLHSIEDDIEHLYIVGDLFDYWFEYKTVIPRVFFPVLNALSNLRNKGIPITLITGNHDMWVNDFIQKDLDIEVCHSELLVHHFNRKIYVAHGDGLGDGDHLYKFLKKVINHPLSKWLFARLHPNFGLGLMKWTSKTSRYQNSDDNFLGQKEPLVKYALHVAEKNKVDFVVMGHRHLPIDLVLNDSGARYIGLGDWTYYQSYAKLNENGLTYHFFESEHEVISNI